MGYWKNRMIEANESGLDAEAADGKFVCANCFTDPALQNVAQHAAMSNACSFCEEEADEAIAVRLEVVMEHINQCLLQLYEDPAVGMGYNGAEGGYQGDHFDSWDFLKRIGMSDYLTEEAEGPLLVAIRGCLRDREWCKKSPYSLRAHEALSYSWQYFCEFIKHERRFFFLQEKPEYAVKSHELFDPGAILKTIVAQAIGLGLTSSLEQGTRVFRMRPQTDARPYRTALELGPPPAELAVQANRMSPPGVVMTYVSEDERTALLETADKDGTYALGTFELVRKATVLDLTKVPEVPSIFDLGRAPVREAIIFLREFAEEMSKPIARDGRVHVEYVPTQVVTEYLRVSPEARREDLEGVRFSSSRQKDGVSLVLFGGRELLCLTQAERQELDTRERRLAETQHSLLRLLESDSRHVSGVIAPAE